jgi:hypothetical protein
MKIASTPWQREAYILTQHFSDSDLREADFS